MIQFKACLARELPAINDALNRATDSLPKPVIPIARHIFDAGGKRLRPLLTVLTARLLGYTAADILDVAITLEMLHAATLLHDDILDSALTRRGKPAAHTLWNVSAVILAGDALLAEGNALIAARGDPRLSLCFSRATSRTSTGEILEIAAQGRLDTSQEDYEEIVRGKTAWLIRAACEMGALAANAQPQYIEAAAIYGENLGMAFQLVDDALDFAPEAVTGKPTGGDVREGKLTLPIRLYRENLPPGQRAAFDTAFSQQTIGADEASAIAAHIRTAGYDSATRRQAETFLTRARTALDAMPSGRERDILLDMANYVRDREK